MDLARRLRISLAAALAIAASAAIATPPASAAHPLEPDLETLRFQNRDLDMNRIGDKGSELRITNEVGNRGPGPLEVYPDQTTSCPGDPDLEPGYTTLQKIFVDSEEDDGVFDPLMDTDSQSEPAGCMQYHPPHSHWHVIDFAEYTLLKEKNAKLAGSGGKAGFCLLDSRKPWDPANPLGTPPNAVYNFAGCNETASDPPDREGISVGWSDIYSYLTVGQEIEVTGLDEGKYCLLSEADPDQNLTEPEDKLANNAVEARIRMNPKPDRLKVEKLGNDCAATP